MSDKFKLDLKIPHYVMPEIKLSLLESIEVAEISAADIKAMKDGDIIAILTGEKDMGGIIPLATQKILTNELLTRTIKTASKPHWSVMPAFWLLVFAVALSALTLLVSFVALPQVQKLLNPEKPSSQSTQPAAEKQSTLQPIPRNSEEKATQIYKK